MPRIRSVDREHFIKAFEEGRDFVKLASEIGGSRRAVYRIVRTFSDEGRRQPHPQSWGRKKFLSQRWLNTSPVSQKNDHVVGDEEEALHCLSCVSCVST